MTEPTTEAYTEQDVSDAAWLVWFARKVRGEADDVARLALDQNPALRGSKREAQAVAAERERIRAAVGTLPEPTLGLKGGVNRAAVLAAIDEAAP